MKKKVLKALTAEKILLKVQWSAKRQSPVSGVAVNQIPEKMGEKFICPKIYGVSLSSFIYFLNPTIV